MKTRPDHICVFEHQSIRLFDKIDDVIFTEDHLRILQDFYGDGVPYFSLIHNGVKFCEHVGVLQTRNLTIEILPKANQNNNKEDWRNILIGMLKSVGPFSIHAPSSSSLRIKPNTILDLYFELFVHEAEYLLHKGLVKTYRKDEENRNSLKGTLYFPQHIQRNFIHQERFFVRHTTYDREHPLNRVIYKTLKLLTQINSNAGLTSRIGALLLNFPELKDIKVSDGFFNKIQYNRKTEEYRNAIEIARLILLNYHPDIRTGQNNVLALMFDMNLLWERFVYVSLRNNKKKGYEIIPQISKDFWIPKGGYRTTIRPDILIEKDDKSSIILDTKWKNLSNLKPSADDLRQMYVYHKYYQANKVALIYPGSLEEPVIGNFFDEINGTRSEQECSIIAINTEENLTYWQEAIADKIFDWIEKKEQQAVTINDI